MTLPARFSQYAENVDEVIGPTYPFPPNTPRARGKMYKLTMSSKDSKFYPGVKGKKGWEKSFPPDEKLNVTVNSLLGAPPHKAKFQARHAKSDTAKDLLVPAPFKRKVWLYVHPDVDRSKPAPLFLFNEGLAMEEHVGFIKCLNKYCCGKLCCCLNMGTAPAIRSFATLVDTLVEEKATPPAVALMLSSGPQGFMGQRNLEFDTADGTYADFIEREVIPFVSKKCDVKITDDPEKRVVYGLSSAAQAAFSMAWHRPNLWRNVVMFSPSMVNLQYPYKADMPLGAWDYHSGKEIIKTADKEERHHLRMVVYSCEEDLGCDLPATSLFNWTECSLRLAKALKEAGYDCRHTFALKARHCELTMLFGELPGALKYVLSPKKDENTV